MKMRVEVPVQHLTDCYPEPGFMWQGMANLENVSTWAPVIGVRRIQSQVVIDQLECRSNAANLSSQMIHLHMQLASRHHTIHRFHRAVPVQEAG